MNINPDNQVNNDDAAAVGGSVKIFLLLLLSPNSGWKKLKKSGLLPDVYARQLFYPLLALTAVVQFAALFYDSEVTVSGILQQAIVAFVAFFTAYFAICVLAKAVTPPASCAKIDSTFGKIYILTALSVLDVSYLLSIIAPQLTILLPLGALYSVYVTCRGVKFLHVPYKESTITAVIMSILVVGIPATFYFLLSALLPQVT